MALSQITTLLEKATEKSTYPINCIFENEDEEAVIPNSITWTLLNSSGTIINNREDISVTPASEVNIVLQGDDLAITDEDLKRSVIIKWTYNSDLGTNLPMWAQVNFTIENIKDVAI